MTAPLALVVEFTLREGARAAFLPLVRENAAQSVAREAGCLRFDVLEPEGSPADVLLYEIYTDRAAFDAHLASEHFRQFDAVTRDLVAAKAVRLCALSENAKP